MQVLNAQNERGAHTDTVTPTTLTSIKFGNTLETFSDLCEGSRNYTILLNRTDITKLGNK